MTAELHPLADGEVAVRWPDVVRVPRARLRAAIARRLFRQAVRRLGIRVLVGPVPTGAGSGPVSTGAESGPVSTGAESGPERWGAGGACPSGATSGPDAPTIRLVRPAAFFARIGTSGLIGFGESYLAGEWAAGEGNDPSGDELARLLTALCAELPHLVPPALQRLRRLAVRYQPRDHENTPRGARTNISRHYDLSNDLFATFLDETLTYSAAIFSGAEPAGPPDWDQLAAAQAAKIDRLLDACAVGRASRVLEIGTGWGELAIRAAARGARVRSITLSEEQLDLARRRVADAGLADRVELELCDYRAVRGSYDAVLSVEMIEAVGEAYWPEYFRTLDRVLAPGGRVGLQAITMPHDRLLVSRRTYTWMQKYVFPGGLLPSVEALRRAAGGTRLRVVDDLAFADGYAHTLRLWRQRFTAEAGRVERLGFDGIFRRMWTFYLAYSEAGFASRYLDVHQFVLARPA